MATTSAFETSQIDQADANSLLTKNDPYPAVSSSTPSSPSGTAETNSLLQPTPDAGGGLLPSGTVSQAKGDGTASTTPASGSSPVDFSTTMTGALGLLGNLIPLGYSMYNNPGQSLSPAEQNLLNLGGPAYSTGTNLLSQYNQGQLTPGAEAQLAQTSAANKARLQDYFSKAGLSDSSMKLDQMNAEQINELAQHQAMLNQELTAGLSAISSGQTPMIEAYRQKIIDDQLYAKAQAQLLGSLSSGGSNSSISGILGEVGSVASVISSLF
jgi:hypothetical protein